ncbi:MAG: radical SAM protein [Deltaproteobacteria bacterium]|nr:radical SAM protein [Deltaproteobacteria bacterium]
MGKKFFMKTDHPAATRQPVSGGEKTRACTFFLPAFRKYDPTFFPGRGTCGTLAVSVTGPDCRLRCQHCGGRILENMRPAVTPEALWQEARQVAAQGRKSLLVSGGARADGTVPLELFIPVLKRIRSETKLKILVHTGLVSPALADGLAEAGIDAALIDIIGHADTIRQVYHLSLSVGDYETSLRLLTERGLPTAPHVVLGLHFGRFLGEDRALEMIGKYPVKAVVLVGFRPLPGTAMAGCLPPAPEEFGAFFEKARGLFPQTPVVLGCERPLGRHRRETERLALEAGLDGIAFPLERTLARAAALNLETGFQEDCCALIA